MTISIVIPTLNEEGVVGNLLGDLARQSINAYEIIVVDSGSTDKTHTEVKSFSGVMLKKYEKGVARQRNHGGKSVTGELIYFLDADTRIKPDFLEKSSRHFLEKKLDIAGMWYLPSSKKFDTTVILGLISLIFAVVQKVSPSASGTGIIVRKSVFEKHGGFDETMKSFEDIEFVARVSKKHKFGIVPQIQRIADRRFRKYGFFRTTGKYIVLSVFFMLRKYRLADRIVYYEFGKHLKTK